MVNKLLMNMIIDNNLPLRILDTKSFKTLFTSLKTNVRIPSVKIVKELINSEGVKMVSLKNIRRYC